VYGKPAGFESRSKQQILLKAIASSAVLHYFPEETVCLYRDHRKLLFRLQRGDMPLDAQTVFIQSAFTTRMGC